MSKTVVDKGQRERNGQSKRALSSFPSDLLFLSQLLKFLHPLVVLLKEEEGRIEEEKGERRGREEREGEEGGRRGREEREGGEGGRRGREERKEREEGSWGGGHI